MNELKVKYCFRDWPLFCRMYFERNKMKKKGNFHAGTSGLVLTEPNKKWFPPAFREGSRLTYYASHNNSIEINSSFYKIPMGKTFANWAEAVPDDFQFTVKLWRGITHEKSFATEDLDRFMTSAGRLGKKKGCLLIQFPAKTNFDAKGLDSLLAHIRKKDFQKDWRIAVEFRHSSWYESEICGILDAYQVSLVQHDMPGFASFPPNTRAPFIYYRFHGEKGDYRGSYTDYYLKEAADKIVSWLESGREVYAYFNNTIGEAVSNLNTLKKLVGQAGQK